MSDTAKNLDSWPINMPKKSEHWAALKLHMSTVSNVLVSSTETGPSKLTVGKIFGGMLILENWKLTKFSAMPPRKHLPVSLVLTYDVHFEIWDKL